MIIIVIKFILPGKKTIAHYQSLRVPQWCSD